MRLGGAVRGKSRSRRGWWLAAAVLGVLVFAVFAAGTAWSLLYPGYVLEDGELAADIAIVVASLSLAVFSVSRARRLGRRVAARADEGRWLPPRDEHDGQAAIDLDAEIRRLRGTGIRAWGFVGCWVVVLVGCVVGMGRIESSAETLLATGAWTAGEVLSVNDPKSGHGAPSMWVRYVAGGATRTAEIVRSSHWRYLPGDNVTVVYDPADPDDVRTVDEKNENQVLVGVDLVPMLLALLGLPSAVAAAVGWRRRRREVRRTGWRAAAVTVVPNPAPRKTRGPDILVRYRDGSGICLSQTWSTRGCAVVKDAPAWVGGTGRDMVVLFPHGRWRRRPNAMPAVAQGERVRRLFNLVR
ncbi:DUF3592 domain-containing protein [Amycolatopsis sp. NPDC003676]